MSSTSVKNVFLEAFTLYGLSNVLLSDNASNFTSAEIEDFLNTFGILHRRSSVMNSRVFVSVCICEAAIKRTQNRTGIYQPKTEDLRTYLGLICFELNTQKLEGSKLTSFQKVYHRDSAWVIQIPSLSNTRKKSLSDPIKKLYENAFEIQQQILSEISNKRSLLGLEAQRIKLKEGDIVRIRQMQKRNTNKKMYQPFSAERYRVDKINRFTKVCRISELIKDEAFHPKYFNVHARFLIKIPQYNAKNDDFEPLISEKLSENQPANFDSLETESEVCLDKEQSEDKKNVSFKIPDKEGRNKPDVVDDKKDKKGNKNNKPPSTHRMTLRKRD